MVIHIPYKRTHTEPETRDSTHSRHTVRHSVLHRKLSQGLSATRLPPACGGWADAACAASAAARMHRFQSRGVDLATCGAAEGVELLARERPPPPCVCCAAAAQAPACVARVHRACPRAAGRCAATRASTTTTQRATCASRWWPTPARRATWSLAP